MMKKNVSPRNCPGYGLAVSARGIFRVVCFFLFAAAHGSAETSSSEAAIWQTALAFRAESFTMAPGGLLYGQYYINREGIRSGDETGRMNLVYDESGKAAISIDWAKRGERDFTAERVKRFERHASRFTGYLSFTTPFDPNVQEKLLREPGTLVYIDGKALWEYEFRLPVDRRRSFVGKARVAEDGRPHDFRYTLSPMPFVLDLLDMHIVFTSGEGQLLFESLEYVYEASFLFWDWKGGGEAGFDNWERMSVPPRIN